MSSSVRERVIERRARERKKRRLSLILTLLIPGAGQLVSGRIGIGIFGIISDSLFVLLPVFLIPQLRENNYQQYVFLVWLLGGTAFALYYLFMAYDAYRGTRLEHAPCRRDCPADINVPDYIALVAAGRYSEADELVRERAPFAGTLGRICPAPCETVCTRTRIEEPIAIRSLKRAAQERKDGEATVRKSKVKYPHKIAVVGAGPSGLTCAHFLAQKGYEVDLMDCEKEPGGLLRSAIPAFRLPRKVVEEDVNFIVKSNPGINFKCSHLGTDATLQDLEDAYDAVYLGIGLTKPRQLSIEGENLDGVISGLTFLKEVNRSKKAYGFKGHVAVFGGGDVAMDAARSAKRLGAKKVTVYYRRRHVDMPANDAEIKEAQAEGINIEYLVAPIEFCGKRKVEKVDLARLSLVDPEKGRDSPLEICEHEMWFEKIQTAIVAIGQTPDQGVTSMLGLATNRQGRLKVNRRFQTSQKKVFAGGDITGTEAEPTVVEAIAEGRKAALNIDLFLRPRFAGRLFRRLRDFDPDFKVEKVEGAAWLDKAPRVKQRLPEHCEHDKIDFKREAMCGLADGGDRREAARCLRCQRYSIGFAYKKGKQKEYVSLDERK